MRQWARRIYQLTGIKLASPVMEKLICRLREDHLREVHLPSCLYLLHSRSTSARYTLTQLCAHPDSPSEAAAVRPHCLRRESIAVRQYEKFV